MDSGKLEEIFPVFFSGCCLYLWQLALSEQVNQLWPEDAISALVSDPHSLGCMWCSWNGCLYGTDFDNQRPEAVFDQNFCSGLVSKFWAYASVLSEAPELVDTMRITLGRQKLIVLHWHCAPTALLHACTPTRARLPEVAGTRLWFLTLWHSLIMPWEWQVSESPGSLPHSAPCPRALRCCVIDDLVFHWVQHARCHSQPQSTFWSSLVYLSDLVYWHFFEARHRQEEENHDGTGEEATAQSHQENHRQKKMAQGITHVVQLKGNKTHEQSQNPGIIRLR